MNRCRGGSLYVVLVIIGILVIVTSSMTMLFMSTLNFTQAFYNGDSAQSEAEAGVAEVLARLTEDPTFGMNGEVIRSTSTPNVPRNEHFHVVSFAPDSGYPYSTNNLDGSRSSGSVNRSVPTGTVHVISTGVSKGQICTIEAIIEHPPFPYGLATSGKIESRNSMVVKGSQQGNPSEDEDRPGHLVSNSPQGVVIRSSPSNPSYISGFIKSVGPIEVGQPAEVRGGTYPFSSSLNLPSIDAVTFRPMPGESGFLEVESDTFGSQILDVMYRSSHDVNYMGTLELRNAFLFVDGNVTIEGGLRGTGAIVATGDVTIKGGTSLSASNSIAVVSNGKITLAGAGNFFQGLLIARSGLEARNIVVVGIAIVNNPDSPEQGTAQLDQVTFIADRSQKKFQFTAHSSTEAERKSGNGRLPFLVDDFGSTIQPDYDPLESQRNLERLGPEGVRRYTQSLMDLNLSNVQDGLVALSKLPIYNQAVFNGGGRPEDDREAGIFDAFQNATEALQAVGEAHDERILIELEMAKIQERRIPANNPDTEVDEAAVARAQQAADLAAEQAKLDALFQNVQNLTDHYQRMADLAVEAYVDYYRRNAAQDGTYQDGHLSMDIMKKFDFDINTYLPPSEHFRISFWQLYAHRL